MLYVVLIFRHFFVLFIYGKHFLSMLLATVRSSRTCVCQALSTEQVLSRRIRASPDGAGPLPTEQFLSRRSWAFLDGAGPFPTEQVLSRRSSFSQIGDHFIVRLYVLRPMHYECRVDTGLATRAKLCTVCNRLCFFVLTYLLRAHVLWVCCMQGMSTTEDNCKVAPTPTLLKLF